MKDLKSLINFFDFVESSNLSEENKKRFAEDLKLHKYYLEKKLHIEMTESEAISSWQEYVYEPLYYSFIREKFEEKTKMNFDKAFYFILDRWHFLKENVKKEDYWVRIEDAVLDIIREHKPSFLMNFKLRKLDKFRKKSAGRQNVL